MKSRLQSRHRTSQGSLPSARKYWYDEILAHSRGFAAGWRIFSGAAITDAYSRSFAIAVSHTGTGKTLTEDRMQTEVQQTDLLMTFFGNAANTNLERLAELSCERTVVRYGSSCVSFGPPQPTDAVLE